MTGRGPFIETASGGDFYVLDPQPEEVRIEDIAHATANLCRFVGHVTRFYSVAQHGVLVSEIVPSQHALWGLLHDATEAYVGDVSRPLKDAIAEETPRLSEIEEGVSLAIAIKFGLSWPEPEEVKEADLVALSTERRDLMVPGGTDWIPLPEPRPGAVDPLPPEEAKRAFLGRFRELTQ